MLNKGLGFTIFAKASLFLILFISLLIFAVKAGAATTLDLTFVNHIQANLAEQDVFVVSKDDSSMVVRVEGIEATSSANLSKNLYASSQAVEHDPFKLGTNPLGPFPKGESLGFTLNEWFLATGKGTYTVDGGTANLDLTFEGLVPNGVYTVWCSRLTLPPNPKIVDRPCGAGDGSENSFTAFGNGAGEFKLSLKPLEESSAQTLTVVALAYHSDGKTHGENPGDFGLNSHVQIFAMLPVTQAAATVAPQPTPQVSGMLGIPNQVWIVIVVVIVLLVLGWWWYSKKTPGSPPTPSSEV